LNGWICIHRKILENPIVCKDSDYFAVWLYLLLNSTHKEISALFNGNKITLQAGQLITGRLTIAKKLKISDSKVKRILIDFESDQQIDRQRSSQNSLITILNWDLYQQSDQQIDQPVTSQRPASDQPVTTNNNVIKKQCNNKNIFSSESDEVKLSKLLFEKMSLNNPACREPNFQSWAKHINLLIRTDKQTIEDIEKVIIWCQNDNFWKSNILSTAKLREKFDCLMLKTNMETKNNNLDWS
jgi:hypothetical protein